MQTLKKHGLERFDPAEAGDMFNPNLHEATFQTKVEGKEDGQVFMTQQKGFLLNGRVVRVCPIFTPGSHHDIVNFVIRLPRLALPKTADIFSNARVERLLFGYVDISKRCVGAWKSTVQISTPLCVGSVSGLFVSMVTVFAYIEANEFIYVQPPLTLCPLSRAKGTIYLSSTPSLFTNCFATCRWS